jgi:glycosyltransferase involved in cell wall biosynthesis
VFLTVTIQTYNHAGVLAETLESLRALRCSKNIDYEILVVNNNSTDHTSEVIRSYANILAPRLRSVFEPRQGLSHARNRALHEARGEIVCFIDDDVKVDPGWLQAVSTAFIKYSASVVGGRSYLIYPTCRPAWLHPKRESLLSRVDYGTRTLVNTDKELFGLNFSVLRRIALDVGGFDTNLGRCGKSLISGEEKALLERIQQSGGIIVYEPQAFVGHRVSKKRLSKWWFLKRCYFHGVTSIRIGMLRGKTPKLAQYLEHAIRCWGSLARTAFFDYTKPEDLFDKQLIAASSLGSLIETARHLLNTNFNGTVYAQKSNLAS